MLDQHVIQAVPGTLHQVTVAFRALLLLVDGPGEVVVGDEVEGAGPVPFRVVVDHLVRGRDDRAVDEGDQACCRGDKGF